MKFRLWPGFKLITTSGHRTSTGEIFTPSRSATFRRGTQMRAGLGVEALRLPAMATDAVRYVPPAGSDS